MNGIVTKIMILLLSLMFSACSGQTAADNVQPQLQEMITAKYSAYKAANSLPAGAGVQYGIRVTVRPLRYFLGTRCWYWPRSGK